MKHVFSSCLASALAVCAPVAGAHAADEDAASTLVARAEQQMAITFQNMSIVDFRESQMPGLYQADIGGRIVYYSPDPELLIFGQMFDRSGVDLTSLALSETHAKRRELVDLDKALQIGPTDAPEIVEFSNPDCGVCRMMNNFVTSEEEQGRPIRRKIIFSVFTAQAKAKAEHILCSDDRDSAYQEIYGGSTPEKMNSCPEGHELVETHAQMSRSVGIQGTPTLWLDGRTVQGFRQGEIVAFLQSKRGK